MTDNTASGDSQVDVPEQYPSLQRIPAEIQDQILHDIERSDLVVLSRVSKTLQAAVRPRLYRSITLSWGYGERSDPNVDDPPCLHKGPEDPPPQAHLLLRSLLTNDKLADEVQSFSLLGEALYHWRRDLTPAESRSPNAGQDCEEYLRGKEPPPLPFSMESFSPDQLAAFASKLGQLGYAIDECPPNASQLQPYVLTLLISLLPRVAHLEIESDFFRCHAFVSRLTNLSRSGHFNRLESVKLCADVPFWPFKSIFAVRSWENALLSPLSLPRLRHLDVNATLDELRNVKLSSIESFAIRHLHEGSHCLVEHLQNMPRLRSLEYRDWFFQKHYLFQEFHLPNPLHKDIWKERNWESRKIPDPLFQLLQPVCETLERLVITARVFCEYHYEWNLNGIAHFQPVWGLFTHLKAFSRLKTLEIPWALVLGYDPGLNVIDNWGEVFPPSLRDLTWTDYLTEYQADVTDPRGPAFSVKWPVRWENDIIVNVAHLAPWLASCRTYPTEQLHFSLKLMRQGGGDWVSAIYRHKIFEPDQLDVIRAQLAAFNIGFTFFERGEHTRYDYRWRPP